MTVLLIVFAILNLTDGWTTYQGIRLGAKEAWIPKYLFAITGVYWGLVLMKVGIVAVVWYWQPFTFNGMAIVDIGYALLIVWNFVQLQKQKTLNKK